MTGDHGQVATWERQPADLVRLVGAAVVCAISVGAAVAQPEQVRRTSTDLARLVRHLPTSITVPLIGLLQVGAMLAPAAALLIGARGRWREVVIGGVAALLTAGIGLLLAPALDAAIPSAVLGRSLRPSWITDSAFPSGTYVAAASALITVLVPSLPRPWRRFAWWSLGLVAVCRVIAAVEAPTNIVATVSLGVAVGSAVLFVLGAPARRPAVADVAAALQAAGLDVRDLAPADGDPTSPTGRPVYTATVGDRRAHIRVLDRDERTADLLGRAARKLVVSGNDERWPASTRQAIETEALAHFLARAHGAHVAEPIAVGPLGAGSSFLATELIEGVTLQALEVASAGPDDELLARAFASIAALQRARVAHGRPTLEHFLVDIDGRVWLVDMQDAIPGADDRQLTADVVQLVVAVAARVGAVRAVALAAEAFDRETLAATLPMLQPLVLAPALARACRADRTLLPSLRAELERTTGAGHVELAPIQRITVRRAVTVVGTLVLANLVITLVSNFDDTWRAIENMDRERLPLLVVLAFVPYVAGAVAQSGAVDVRLPFLRTTQVMFAQSFLNRFTPANTGGMALRARFLQRHGVTLVGAAASVGITSASSGIVQIILAAVFFTWAGTDAQVTNFRLPSIETVLIVVVVLLAIAGIALATRSGKRLLGRAKEGVDELVAGLVRLVREPARLATLLGGTLVGKLAVILAFQQAAGAFGIAPGLPVLGAVYITASTVSAAAPTPGGVGAIEAALTAGLTGVGYPAGPATAAVVVFRLAVYWLPILPSWFALASMRKLGDADD